MATRLQTIPGRHVAGAILALIGVVAYVHATIFAQIIAWKLAPDVASLAAKRSVEHDGAVSTPPPGDHATSARAILDRNPFDSTTPRPLDARPGANAGEPAVLDRDHCENAPPCDGMRALIVVSSPADPDWSMAALSSGASPTRLVRTGDDIGGKTVRVIEWNRVVLSSGASLCQLQMFRTSKAPAAIASQAARPPPLDAQASEVPGNIASRIQKVSATEINVDRQVVDRILENQAELFKRFRIVPEKRNGANVGIRLLGIDPNSLAGMLGLQNGDQLQTINGLDMTSPEKILEAYARLRTADHLTVQVNREGKDVNIDLNIR
jgi:general secretion pathway protein C